MEALLAAFGVNAIYSETRFLKTGAEGYICLNGLEKAEAKYLAVIIESMSPKARLLDVDVRDKDGAVSRGERGLDARKCLICDEDAKACARSQKHSIEELLAKVNELCYDKNNI